MAVMEDDDEGVASLRAQLTAAIANVRGQIEVQRSTTGYLNANVAITGKEIAIRELQTELAQLEEALAKIGSDDA